jgi:hypothetical protein
VINEDDQYQPRRERADHGRICLARRADPDKLGWHAGRSDHGSWRSALDVAPIWSGRGAPEPPDAAAAGCRCGEQG